MSLPSLPGELQDLIITGLHPRAALALSMTNHFYHSVVSLDRLDPDTVRGFLYDLENRTRNQIQGPLHGKRACYKCLSLKPGWHFSYSQGTGSFVGPKQHNCQCVQCDVRDGSLNPGDLYCPLLKLLVCIECLDACECYCKECLSCARCLKKKGVIYCEMCQWCCACVESKPTKWKAKIFRYYTKDTSPGGNYQISESQDPLDMMISCGRIQHAKFHEKARLKRTTC